ncbi:Na(+)/H(+) antiporter subunit D [Limisphaera sp. VF-2]|uniref:Na(+)/H(+) antiporter subunit D n=1 Tax=Limisphaera sp. VF-2 TaxID=3400418 RepID=UPI003C1738B0
MNDFWLHPSWILLGGAALLSVFPRRWIPAWLMAVPLLTFARVLTLTPGEFGQVDALGFTLVFGRVDALSRLFAYIMALMTGVATLYGLHVRERGQHVAAWTYAAGSLGAILAGDLLTLFLFWELMALASVFLIWYRRTRHSLEAGYRYLLVHLAGGVSLLAGIIWHFGRTGSLAFEGFDVASPGPAQWLILVGFLLNAAVPPLHAWLPDAYAEGTFNGSVFLSALTTKTAVYALCRGFAGLEVLVPLGVIMALYGVVYAVLENDCRRLLAYHIISQVGYMVAGVGIGTELAINGACAHAFAHILYKGLLFMGCGAVLHMTGQSKFTELGGLWEKMPWAFVFTLVGGLSISAFPLFSGFVSKSMVVAAAFEDHRALAAFLLMLASVGTFLHTGLKVPYFIWFGKNRCRPETWERAREAPWNMNLAMAVASFLCIFIGTYTPYLYSMLPHPVHYEPYTAYHVSETLQLLLFTAVGFFLLLRKLEPEATISLDMDWFYRMGGRVFLRWARHPVRTWDDRLSECYRRCGLAGLKVVAGWVRAFDQVVIDGLVDGLAVRIGWVGSRLRTLQRGPVQESLTVGLAVLTAGVLLVWWLWR